LGSRKVGVLEPKTVKELGVAEVEEAICRKEKKKKKVLNFLEL
jgi:hypothetical protein